MRWVIESPALHETLLETLMGLHQRYLGLLSESLEAILPPDQNPRDAAAGIMAALHGNMLLGLFDSSEGGAEMRRASTGAILSWLQPK